MLVMSKAELKTKITDASVSKFLAKISDKQKREDSQTILGIMQSLTGDEPKMWGSSIVGFGGYHYKYESGREGDWFRIGFSPRKQNIVIYLMTGFKMPDGLMKKLGKYKTGKSCLYINKLIDVDIDVLKQIIYKSFSTMAV